MRIRIGEVRLFFDVEGSKLRPQSSSMREVPTLLLLHGGPGADHSTFKPAFSALASIAQVIYLDLRGNWRSDAGLVSKLSLEQWTQDVHSFCKARSIDRSIVFGHSMGGIVAMLYAIRHPNHLLKLVLSSTSTQPVGRTFFCSIQAAGWSKRTHRSDGFLDRSK